MAKRSRADSDSAPPPPGASEPSAEPAVTVKYVHVDAALAVTAAAVMKCALPPHRPLEFASYEEYDVHYQEHHMNRCSECRKNFPSEQLLNLHLSEIHDPINDVRKARGEKIYACFAEGCDKKCSEPHKRRMHMIAKHHFPEDYDFAIIKDGIDGRSSMLRSSRHDKLTRGARKGNRRGISDSTKTDQGSSAAGASSESKGPARKHIIFSEDGSTPMDVVADTETKAPSPNPSQDMDTTNDEQSTTSSTKHIVMSAEEQQPSVSLAISRHATDEPLADIGRAPRKGKQRQRGTGKSQGWRESPSNADASTASSPLASSEASEDPMEGITKSMSALQFVPPSIRFGRGGRGRGGFAKR